MRAGASLAPMAYGTIALSISLLSSFGKFFRKHTGLTPREYKN
jgi:hypothetical protein